MNTMNEEMFPEESMLDAGAMFQFLSERFDFDPGKTMLEWVFAVESESSFDDDSMSSLFETFTQDLEEDEPDIRAEIHEVHDHDEGHDHAHDDESCAGEQLLLIYNGIISQEMLEGIHKRLAVAASTMDAQYIGVECGEVGEMDGLKVGNFIQWTESVLDESSGWDSQEFPEFAKRMREFHVSELTGRGLEVADSMPTADTRGYTTLRPKEEIARRLMAAFATVAWVCAPTDVVSDEVLKAYVENNGLKDSFSSREANWIGMPRDEVREFAPQAGWITENVWGLAWLLGSAPTVCACDQQIPQAILVPIRDQLLCGFEKNFDALLAETTLQPLERIITLEDFLYCAHNGMRNLGDVELAGMVQERRQALTWALSPGVAWDDTDVST